MTSSFYTSALPTELTFSFLIRGSVIFAKPASDKKERALVRGSLPLSSEQLNDQSDDHSAQD